MACRILGSTPPSMHKEAKVCMRSWKRKIAYTRLLQQPGKTAFHQVAPVKGLPLLVREDEFLHIRSAGGLKVFLKKSFRVGGMGAMRLEAGVLGSEKPWALLQVLRTLMAAAWKSMLKDALGPQEG